MPSARPVWKGQLRLSLVSIPVELYSATKSGARVSFRQIHEPSGKPVHYQKVVEGVGPVDPDDILKGFEYEKGNFVLLTDDEIDAVKLETRKTLELTQFVDAHEIDPIFYNKPYFLVPADDLAEDAFRVVRDALKKTGKVGLGQLALRGQEYLAAITPTGTGLLLETLHYEDEVRKYDPFFSEISGETSDDDLLGVATELIKRKSAPFHVDHYKDHYKEALRDLIKTKLSSRGKKTVETSDEAPKRSGDNVIDLMAALKESLQSSEGKPASGKSGAKTSASKSETKSASKSSTRSSAAKKNSAAQESELAMAGAKDLLKQYREKRDFAKTEEPSGGTSRGRAKSGALSFVVQKHDASRLHYDFRIELDGVLKSWAVTKGPSTNPADKRLAVHVEDHPLDYGAFEGTIPQGEYGGGTVMLWDQGTWEPIGDPHEGLEKGDLKMRINGQRMKGEWVLVHMKGRDNKLKNGAVRENWLLIKHKGRLRR